jgi:hypothetical protein
VRAFDMHRTGSYKNDYSDEHPNGRRCLTDEEKIAKGMYLNSAGRWSQPVNGRPERLRARGEQA